jgi:O-antigen/teichoic acid export membrane protein
MALLLLIQQLGSMGLVSANPYFGVQARASLQRIIANSIVVAVVVGSLLGTVALLVCLFWPAAMRGLTPLDVGLVAVAAPGGLLFLFLQSVFLGEGRMRAYNLVELAQSLLSTIVLAVGLYVFRMGVTGSIAVFASASWLGALAYLTLLRMRTSHIGPPDLALARRMVRYAFRIYVATLMSYLIVRLDLFLVNVWLGPRQAGLYGVAGSLADALFIVPMVIGLNVFPRVARGASTEMTATVFRLVTIIYGGFVVASMILARPIIAALYGSSFGASAELYCWLAPGVFSLGLVTVLSYHFAGRGFPLHLMLVWFVGLVVNVVINVLFLEGSGTYVASLSSSIAYTLVLVLYLRLFAREIGGLKEVIPRPSELAALARATIRRVGPMSTT